MNKNHIICGVIIIAVGAGAFYGGTMYERNANQQQLANATQQPRNGGGQGGQGGFGNRRNGGNGGAAGGFVSGEVISKDDTSVTVKLRDGGSKIILFSKSTMIGKTTEGTAADIEVGKQITANGTADSSGTITAQNIQIRPAAPINPSSTTPKQ